MFVITKKQITLFAVLITCIPTLVGCGPQMRQVIRTSTLTPITSKYPIPANTQVPTSTITPSPTASVTPTPRPSTTRWPTATPTRTSLPSLVPTEAQALLMELYEKNGGCQLPCWWGFEPGKTRWDTARKLLEKFDSSIYYPDPRLESVSYDVYIPTESEFWYPAPRRQIYIVENGIINRIEVKVVNLFPYSDLITMFQRYGEPEEIWVSALAGDNPESAVLLYLIVFYREKGIMTWYADGYLAKIDGDTLVGCPHLPDRGLSMQLWNPLERYSFAEMLEKSVDFPREEPHLRLEEATGISEHGYYDMLVNSSSPQCLKSPVELWLRFPQ